MLVFAVAIYVCGSVTFLLFFLKLKQLKEGKENIVEP